MNAIANRLQNTITQPTPPAAKRMKLGAVVSGKLDRPLKTLLYGLEGVGKSTFAASAPKPIFLGAEGGTAQLDIPRFPEASNWQDVLDAIAELTIEAHDFRTLAIDTLDWIEPMCWARVCEKGDGKGKIYRDIEQAGYGKGYICALDEWRIMLRGLERLMAVKQMNVIMLAHAHIKTFKNPEGEDYDRYSLKMNDKAAGLLKEWADDVLFAKYETFSAGKDTRKAISDGARVVHTTRMAAWDAKNRHSLPDTMPLSWTDYYTAVQACAPASPERIEAQIRALLPRLNGNAQATEEAIKRANGDAQKLAVLLDWVRGKIGIEQSESKEETQS